MTGTEKTNYEYKTVPSGENTKENEKKESIPSYGYGVRHVQALLMFVCLTTSFIARAHLGVTIVAMVDPSIYSNVTTDGTDLVNEFNATNNNSSLDALINGGNASDAEPIFGNSSAYNVTMAKDTESAWDIYRTYKWSKSTQELILSSFFLGYFIMMTPMGWVCQRWGGKLPLQICLSVNGIISILTPWIVAWGGWKLACCCRIAQGLSQAGAGPSTMNLLSAWVPLSERASLSTYVYTGIMVGTVVAFQVGGLLAASPWGWPSTFWFSGVLCLVAFVLFTIFVSATPREHRFISEEERNFILGDNNSGTVKNPKTPWKEIVSSKHVWAIFSANIGSGLSFYFIFTQVSSYLHYVLEVDVGKSGMLSSLPYIASFFASIIMGYLSDYFTNKNIISMKSARRFSNTIGGAGLALCVTALSFVQSTPAAVACLVLAMVAQSGIHTGAMVNYMDLSPRYSGTLMATGNTLMNLSILTLPMLVSNIVTDVTDPQQWRIMLLLVAAVSFASNVVFVTFMAADRQPWDDQDQVTDEETKGSDAASKENE